MGKERMGAAAKVRRERKKIPKQVRIATGLLRVNNFLAAVVAAFFVGFSIFILSTTALRQLQLYCYIYNALGAAIFGISLWSVGKPKYTNTAVMWVYMFVIVCCIVLLSIVGLELFITLEDAKKEVAIDVVNAWTDGNPKTSRLLPANDRDLQDQFDCCGKKSYMDFPVQVSCAGGDKEKYKNRLGCVDTLTNLFAVQVDLLLISNWTLLMLELISFMLCCYIICKLYDFNLYRFLMLQRDDLYAVRT